ncbi:hypothetical protein [Nodularia chucula]|uniref:hypothetical protein n=1 Tax=Nodularia chucula TaxID=3093667 RepID=UPI0039C7535B
MDEHLQQLLQALSKTEQRSRDERQIIGKILKLIPNLPGICRNYDPKINYEDAFNRAIEGVWLGIRKFVQVSITRILNANAEINRRSFVAWFNRILKNKIFDLYRQHKKQPLSLDIQIAEESDTHLNFLTYDINITSIEQLITEEEIIQNKEKEKRIKSFLEQDEELLKCKLKNNPQCNCQALIKLRMLKQPPEIWQEIGKYFQIASWKTIESHWRRKCLPLLNQISLLFYEA